MTELTEGNIRQLYEEAVGSGRPVSQNEINFYLNDPFFNRATPGVIDENERKAFFEAIARGGETLINSAQEGSEDAGDFDLDAQGFTRLVEDDYYYTKKRVIPAGYMRQEQTFTDYYDQDNKLIGEGATGLAKAKDRGLSENPAGANPPPTSELNADRIRRGYDNILFRTPTQDEIDSYRDTRAANFISNLKNSPEYYTPKRGIQSIYKEVVGRLPNEQEIGTNLDIVGKSLSSFEGNQLAGKLREEQLDKIKGRLGIATKTKDETRPLYSNFNKVPTNAGISRLRPIPNYGENTAENITRLYQAETGRTPNQAEIDFYVGDAGLYGDNIDPSEVLQFRQAPESQTFGGAATQQPFTAPTDVFQRVAYDPEAEGVGPTMADVFGYEAYNPTISPDELAAQDRRAADIAAFTGDARMEAGQLLSNVQGIDPVTGTELEAQVDDGTYTGLDVGGGMYGGGLATLYNKGGEVNNVGLEGLGQKMAAYGRYGDTMLAHISPEEAMMLKAMGGSGTRNPVTGLPEFFLKKAFKILKSILPAAIATVNPPLGAALAAADAGFKDGKFNLKKAALAGIKTYALAKVGQKISGVEGSGAVDPSTAVGSVAGDSVSSAYYAAGPSAALPAGATTSTAGVNPSIATQVSGALKDPKKLASDLGDVAIGFKDATGEFIKGGGGARLKGTATPAAIALTAQGAEAGMKKAEEIKREADALNYDAEKRKREQKEKALVALAPGFGYAQGGISSLAPRYLDGAGDGMSDSIRANIDGQQEARLADGEFVIPADVVADMGNGSSNAGAERLYSMMDRIRESRHGTTKQPPEVNVNNMMPA